MPLHAATHQHFHIQRLAVFLGVVAEELPAQLGAAEVTQQVLQHWVIWPGPATALVLLAWREQVQPQSCDGWSLAGTRLTCKLTKRERWYACLLAEMLCDA